MKLIATLATLTALAVAPATASAQVLPGTMGATTAEPNGIIAILIGYTPPIGSNKGSFTAPIGSNKGSFVTP
jgi:hypothetical protein